MKLSHYGFADIIAKKARNDEVRLSQQAKGAVSDPSLIQTANSEEVAAKEPKEDTASGTVPPLPDLPESLRSHASKGSLSPNYVPKTDVPLKILAVRTSVFGPNLLPYSMDPRVNFMASPNGRLVSSFVAPPITPNSRAAPHFAPSPSMVELVPNGYNRHRNGTSPMLPTIGSESDAEDTSHDSEDRSKKSAEELEIARALVHMSYNTPGFVVRIKPSRRLNTIPVSIMPDVLCSTPYKYILELSFPKTFFPDYTSQRFDIYVSIHGTGARYDRGMKSELQKTHDKGAMVKQVYLIQFLTTSFKSKGRQFEFYVDRFYKSTPFKLVARKQSNQNEFWDKQESTLAAKEKPKRLEDMYSFEEDPEKACAAQLVSLLRRAEQGKKRKRTTEKKKTTKDEGLTKLRKRSPTRGNDASPHLSSEPPKKKQRVAGDSHTPHLPNEPPSLPGGISPPVLPQLSGITRIVTQPQASPYSPHQPGFNMPNSHAMTQKVQSPTTPNGTRRPVLYVRSQPHLYRDSPGAMVYSPTQVFHPHPQQHPHNGGSPVNGAPMLSSMPMRSATESGLHARRPQLVPPPPVNTSGLKPPQRPSPLSAPTPPQSLMINRNTPSHTPSPVPAPQSLIPSLPKPSFPVMPQLPTSAAATNE